METTPEEILTRLIEKGYYAYKKNFRKYCPKLSRMLDRKEPVVINEQEYRCWTELVVHNIGNLIQEYLPNTQCEVILDMNDSQLVIDTISAEDEKIITNKLIKMTGEK